MSELITEARENEAEKAEEVLAPEAPVIQKRTDDSSVISVPGTITRQTYESVKKYLITPGVKLFFLCAIALELLVNLYGLIVEHSMLSLVLMVVLGGIMIWIYLRMPANAVKNVVKNHKELREHGFRVLISFGRQIRLMNHTTGVERTMDYKSIYSMAETDKALILFALKDGKRRYMLVPKEEMREEQRDAILALIQSRCGKLKKRW